MKHLLCMKNLARRREDSAICCDEIRELFPIKKIFEKLSLVAEKRRLRSFRVVKRGHHHHHHPHHKMPTFHFPVVELQNFFLALFICAEKHFRDFRLSSRSFNRKNKSLQASRTSSFYSLTPLLLQLN